MPDKSRSPEKLFEAALKLSPKSRAAFLDQECASSPSLRRLVEELLKSDAEAGSFLRNGPFGDFATTHVDGVGPITADAPHTPSGTPLLFRTGTVAAGRFAIQRFIARGGMGEVYEAWDQELRERVAIKTVRPELAGNTDMLERFRREVKQARAISHPNVCRVHEIFCHDANSTKPVWFLSMEFLEGSTLVDYIRHNGPLDPKLAFQLVQQIVQGLSAAHRLGVIHRDFKTGNVMLVSSEPGRMRVAITDFGLAFNALRRDGEVEDFPGEGTPAYMAPEQVQTGKVTALADQYALGIVICEILTGSRPKKRGPSDVLSDPMLTLPAKPMPARWRRAILRCTQQRPEDRFKSLDDLVIALEAPKDRRMAWLAAAAISLMAAGLFYWRPFSTQIQPTSLAVLPLRNETGDPALEYVADGISEALTNDLSNVPGLQVTAGSVARRFHGDVDPRTVGQTLQVRSVVGGALANSGGRLRVPIELIDTRTGRQRWGQTYETSPSELPELQHEISTDVAYSLKIKLDRDTRARLTRQYSTNPATYDAYLKGRFHLGQRTPQALEEAINDFQRALDQDPQYAPAFAGLADTYSLIGHYGLQNPIASFTKALTAAQQALELDSTLGEAYASRALARTLLSFEWQDAEGDYRRALSLNPNYLAAHTWYALALLVPLGRRAEASAQMAYAQQADPDSFVTTVSVATMDYFDGDFDKTIATIEPRLKQFQQFEPAIHVLAYAYLAKNEDVKAIKLLETDPKNEDLVRDRATNLGIAYARTGQRAKAMAQLKIAQARLQQGDLIHYETATLYTALNDDDDALKMLREAFTQRESSLLFANVDPMLAPLKSRPEFLKLLGQMHLQ